MVKSCLNCSEMRVTMPLLVHPTQLHSRFDYEKATAKCRQGLLLMQNHNREKTWAIGVTYPTLKGIYKSWVGYAANCKYYNSMEDEEKEVDE